MELSAEELRVLCCLIEKSHTTPEHYPLTTNALVTACNQKTSRDPVVDYGTNQVDQVMQQLRADGWARTIRTSGGRTNKHKHVIDEKLGLTDHQQALVAVLGLRGPQSPGELKTRTERYVEFDSFDAVVAELEFLADRDVPLVRNIGIRPGQSQPRWIQLVGGGGGHDGDGRPPVNADVAADGGDGAASANDAPTGDLEPPRTPTVSAGHTGPAAIDSAVVAELRSELRGVKRRLDAAEARIDELEAGQN
jgi:uncharacterized protein YceH (UPF0502 family)